MLASVCCEKDKTPPVTPKADVYAVRSELDAVVGFKNCCGGN